MRPEYPHEFDFPQARIAEFEGFPLSCTMLRGGYPCGSDAHTFLVCQRPDGIAIAVIICDACRDEIKLSGPETTTYWRAKQREWGVR